MRRKKVKTNAFWCVLLLIFLTGNIENFLKTFVGTSDDFTESVANLDLDDDVSGPSSRNKGLKYMSQLVSDVFSCVALITLIRPIGTHREP